MDAYGGKYGGYVQDVSDGMRGMGKEADAVNALFFSARNADALQNSLRYAVYVRCGKVIDRQSDGELLAVMRNMYENTKTNPYSDPLPQVRALNAAVVDFAAKEIVNAISQHAWYLNDISQPVPLPQSRGTFMSAKGSRTLSFGPHLE